MKHLLIKNARIVNEKAIIEGDLLIAGERILKIARSIDQQPNWEIIDATGNYLIPGLIDAHVHFREPGMTQKGTIETESMSAVGGGVTSFMDMPNTFPNTTNLELLEEKYLLASRSSYANYSFYMGVNSTNLAEALKIDNENVCGLTDDGLYFSDKNSMLCNRLDFLEQLFSHSNSLIALHCEDETVISHNEEIYSALYKDSILPYHHSLIRSEEACLLATQRVIEIAKKYDARFHALHISTLAEANLFQSTVPVYEKRITAEACIHHLYFSDKDYDKKGMQIKWNPSIKTEKDRSGLLKAINENRIDNIATDHAPHLWSEKTGSYFKCLSGAPSVQQTLPVLLELFSRNEITMENIVQKTSHNPAEIFKIIDRGFIREGYYADLVLVDTSKIQVVKEDNLLYKCGWSPFVYEILHGSVLATFVNGRKIYEDGMFTGERNPLRLKFKKNR